MPDHPDTTPTAQAPATRVPRIAMAVLLALALFLSAAAAASADSILFTKPDGNIYLANPDGSGQYQVTLDGTAADPYMSPSETTDGTIVADHGTGANAQLVRMSQNGTLLNQPFGTAAPFGPLDPVVSPNGQYVAYWGVTAVNGCYPFICVGAQSFQLVTNADHLVDPSTLIHDYTGQQHASWLSNSRLMEFSHNGTIWYYDLGSSTTMEWLDWSSVFDYNTMGLGYWFEGAASSDGTKLAVVAGVDNTGQYEIQVFQMGGDLATGNPPAQPTAWCPVLPPDNSLGSQGSYNQQEYLFHSISWSPDGRAVVFEYNGAIYVAHVGDLTNCTTIPATEIVPSGSHPFWSSTNINPAPRPQLANTNPPVPVPPNPAPPKPVPPLRPCANLTGSPLQICQAGLVYRAQLAGCDRLFAHTKSKDVRCLRSVTAAYHRKLALIKCARIKNPRSRAACVSRAQKLR